jgi:hypothetical protein
MRSYGTEDHDPFIAETSQVAYAVLAAPRILSPVDIGGIYYEEACEWNNPTLEAMNEASNIWPKQIINLISIGNGIEGTPTQPKMESPDSKFLERAIKLSEISERIHLEVISNWEMFAQGNSKYIRLYGISRVGLKEWGKEYIESGSMQKQIEYILNASSNN